MTKLKLEHFRRALKGNPDAVAELPDTSYRRYVVGDFPSAIRWLLKYPDLLKALERDARVITAEELAALEREAKQRSRKVQAARKQAGARSRKGKAA